MMTARTSGMGLLLLIAGAAADSTSGIFTRLLTADAFTTASGRGFFAFGLLFAILCIRERGLPVAAIRRIGPWGALFVTLNAAAMVTNVLSLKNTAVANFFMIFATAPFVAAVMARFVVGERLDRATLLASVAGFAGIAVMMLGGATAGGTLGNVLAVVVVLAYAAIVLIFRKVPGGDVLVLITLTVLGSACLSLPMADFSGLTPPDWAILAALGCVQLGLGNILIYAAVARIPAAQAGLLGILIAAFAPLWVFLVLGEVPPPATILGGAIILGAAGLHLAWSLRRPAAMA